MKKAPWCWLLLAALPGCLIAQPLDSASGDEGSNAGSGATGDGSSRSGAPNVGGTDGSSGAPANVDDTAPFLGTWTADSGTLTLTCRGIDPSSTDVTGTQEVWAEGTDTDLVHPGFQGDCEFTANVSDRTATGLPGQTCTANGTDSSSGDSYSQMLSFDSYEFVVSRDGQTATESFYGTDTYTDLTQNITLTCTFEQTASYTM